MPKAPPSSRATGHLNLSFNLINIPVSVYSGTVSAHGVKRTQFVSVQQFNEDGTPKTVKVTKDDGTVEEVNVYEDHPVGNRNYDKVTDETLEPGTEIFKKIATEYGPVYVEDHEIEKLFSVTPDSIVVKEFEPQHLFLQGHYVPTALFYIEPAKSGTGAKKGPNAIATKLLATLLEGLRKQNAVAVVEMTTRGVPKPCILTSEGKLWQVYHTDALREQRELPEVETVEAEVAMMCNLIQTAWSDSPMDLTDERSALIQAFAEEKAAAGDFDKPEDDGSTVVRVATDAPDLLAMLAASVDQAKAQRSA